MSSLIETLNHYLKIVASAGLTFSETYFQDFYVFWFLQICLLLVLVYSVTIPSLKSNKNSGLTITLTRGPESQLYLYYSASFFVGAVIVTIFSITDVGKGYKIFIFLLDIFVVLYLSLWNSWFRNKIIGWVNEFKTRIEKL